MRDVTDLDITQSENRSTHKSSDIQSFLDESTVVLFSQRGLRANRAALLRLRNGAKAPAILYDGLQLVISAHREIEALYNPARFAGVRLFIAQIGCAIFISFLRCGATASRAAEDEDALKIGLRQKKGGEANVRLGNFQAVICFAAA